jgi:acyl-CoA thioesterase YciA
VSDNTEKMELQLRTQAFPVDANPDGDIFGGWVLSQMDIASGIMARKRCQGRTVTVAVDSMTFIEPVYIGDVICCYGEIIKEGRTSVSIKIEVYAVRQNGSFKVKVTEGVFIYVAIDKNKKPRSIDSSFHN